MLDHCITVRDYLWYTAIVLIVRIAIAIGKASG